MALKPDRSPEYGSDISFYMNEVAERGGVVVLSTVGSGGAMDNGAALVTYAANPSGKLPIGFLMNDMVDVDLTKYFLNPNKDEVQKGSKVNLRTFGWLTTNFIKSGDTPVVGSKAYVDTNGKVTITQLNPVQNPQIGVFLSAKDQDGFAKVMFNFQK